MASKVDHVVDGIVYPASDGLPIGETPAHVENLLNGLHAPKWHFTKVPKVFIAADMFIYYEEGNPRKHVSPDVFVSRGARRQYEPLRNCYLVWMEGKMVDVVIELTSKSTVRVDLGRKKKLYERLGVQEYFLFDPHEETLDPSMQGFRLNEARFEPIKPIDGRLPSKVLDLHLERDGVTLQYFDLETESWLWIPFGERARHLQALEARIREDRKAREQVEAEIKLLRQRLKELEKTQVQRSHQRRMRRP